MTLFQTSAQQLRISLDLGLNDGFLLVRPAQHSYRDSHPENANRGLSFFHSVSGNSATKCFGCLEVQLSITCPGPVLFGPCGLLTYVHQLPATVFPCPANTQLVGTQDEPSATLLSLGLSPVAPFFFPCPHSLLCVCTCMCFFRKTMDSLEGKNLFIPSPVA